MEKVNEIYNNIKDRLSNPFVFSFMLSWLIFNWRITVALIWYDKTQFSGCGCNTIFDFISYQLAKDNTIIGPLFFAAIYTLLIPFVKNGIRIVYAHAQKWGEEEEIKALDGGKIGIEKYLSLRDDYKNRIKDLENVANEEKSYLDENRSLILEINTEKEKLNENIKKGIENQTFIDELNNINILQGNWICKLGQDIPGITYSGEIMISQNDIYEVNDFNNREKIYVIQHFYYNIKQNKIFFIKEKIVDNSIEIPFENKYKINDLYFKDEFTLVGTENGNNVEYMKKFKVKIKKY